MSPSLDPRGLRRLHDALAGHVARGDVPRPDPSGRSRRGVAEVDVLGTTAAGGAASRCGRDSIVRINSSIKPVTAAAAMALIDDGKVALGRAGRPPAARARRSPRAAADRRSGLDDTVPAHRPITVRDLLSFTLGMAAGLLAPPGKTEPIQRALDELRLAVRGSRGATAAPPPDGSGCAGLGTLPLMHQPGERWMYNTGRDWCSAPWSPAPTARRSKRCCDGGSSTHSA